MTKQQQQADSVIHEDQLLNFLVNALTGAFGVSIAGNGDTTPEDIYEVLVGATADGTSISTLCERSEDSDSGNNILYHLDTKFDLETVRSVGNTLLREYTLEMLPEQVEIVVDFHLRPYYGDEDETDGLYYSEAKRGTTAFHAYATLYARVRNKRYTLAVRRVTHGDTASSVLAEFLGLVDDFDFDVKAVYVDREFYDGKCLTLMQAHNHAYVMPIVKWGTKIQNELSEGWSREIEHDLTTEFDGHEWTSKRFGIEATYRLSEASLISTTSKDSTRRLLFVVISLLMQNVWRYLHWEYVATSSKSEICGPS